MLGLMFGTSEDNDPVAYTETFYPRLHYGWSELRALYHQDLKLIDAPEMELFRISNDIQEQTNLVTNPSFNAQKKEIRDKLRDFVDRKSENALETLTAPLSREDREALRALGYATSTLHSTDGAALADPKEKIDIYNRLSRATDSLERQRYDEAITAATEVLQAEPDLVEALVLLGNIRQRQGNYQKAVHSFERVLELKPDANFTMIDIVSCLINMGNYDRAISRAKAFIEKFPNDPTLYEELGFAHFYKRDLDQALEFLQKSIDIEPNSVSLSKAGEVHALKGDHTAAKSYLERALAMNPKSKGTYYVMAHIEESNKNFDKAVEYYEKKLENNPSEYKAAFNIAVILKNQGRYDLAVPYYRKTIDINPRFNMSYFMIANYYLEAETNLGEAIDICKKGIGAAPQGE